jgi:hypothetical protein
MNKFKVGDICYYRGFLAQIPKYVLVINEIADGVKELMFLEDGYKFVGKEPFLLPLDYFDKPVIYKAEEAKLC